MFLLFLHIFAWFWMWTCNHCAIIIFNVADVLVWGIRAAFLHALFFWWWWTIKSKEIRLYLFWWSWFSFFAGKKFELFLFVSLRTHSHFLSVNASLRLAVIHRLMWVIQIPLLLVRYHTSRTHFELHFANTITFWWFTAHSLII